MKGLKSRFLMVVLMVLVLPALAHAVETKVTVRVKAHDAKFIGTAVGGLDVVISDAFTGQVLASGMIEGGTGDTKTIMKSPHKRGQRLSNRSTAAFVATLDIDRPTKIKVVVRGPMAAGDNIQEMSRTVWLLPGHSITGDGLLFDLYGFIVYPVAPSPHQFFKKGATVPIEVRVDMMCGCPIKPKGIWDANRYRVVAYVERGGKTVATLPLSFAGKTSIYSAIYHPPGPGGYKVVITASDDATNNFGVGVTGFVVKKK